MKTSDDLAGSEAIHRALLDHLAEGVIVADAATGEVRFCNEEMARLLAYSKEDLLARTVPELHPRSAFPVLEALKAEVRSGRLPPASDLVMLRKDGQEVVVEFTARGIAWEGRQWLLGVARDVSEKRRLEEELSRQEELVRDAAAMAHVGGWEFDPVTLESVWSAETLRIHDLPPGTPPTAPEGIAYFQGESRARIEAAVKEAIEHGTPYDLELEKKTAAGTTKWVRTIGHPVVKDGKVVLMRGSIQDVTERRKAEEALVESREQLAAVLSSMEDLVFSFDLEGRIAGFYGPRGKDLYVPPEVFLGKTFQEVLPPEVGAALRRATEAVALSLEPEHLDYELEIAGRTTWWSGTVSPRKGPGGALAGFTLVSRNITERKKTEEQLLRVQKLEALGTLAGGIAHDFNNILLAISGNARLAAVDVPAGHPAQDALAEITRATARATALVKRILAFSRSDAPGRYPLEVKAAVEEALSLVRATIPAVIEIQTDLDPGLPAVEADPTEIHQVVVNLATNAAHAIGGRVGRIQVRLEAAGPPAGLPDVPGAKGGVRLTVADDGCGMEPETMARVFDPFFSTKPPGEGTGLGLSVVYGIVETMGGAVSVESEPGKGAAFSVWLPAVEAEAKAHAPLADGASSPRSARILYVDDEEALCLLLRRVLSKLGYEVTAISDPLVAAGLFADDPEAFDAVITDVSMPGMSGFDLARRLLALRPDLPIVVTSGYLRPQDEEVAREIGITELLMKPDTVDELGSALDRVLLGRSAEPVAGRTSLRS